MAAERDISGTQLQEDNLAAEGSGSQSQADVILSQMSIFMASLKDFKEDMAGEITSIASKRSKREQPYSLKRTGNTVQMAFVEEVGEHVKEAIWLLQGGVEGLKVEVVLKELTEAQRLLTQRGRLIKIADRSEHGWATVAEYEADKLALDSEDEKRISRAEKEAQKKAVARKRSKVVTTTTAVEPAYSTAGSVAAPRPTTRLIGPCFGSRGI